jgi:hypothetical protein
MNTYKLKLFLSGIALLALAVLLILITTLAHFGGITLYTLGWLDYLIADVGSGLLCLVLAGWLIKQGVKR